LRASSNAAVLSDRFNSRTVLNDLTFSTGAVGVFTNWLQVVVQIQKNPRAARLKF
jgi:hypothetical protein